MSEAKEPVETKQSLLEDSEKKSKPTEKVSDTFHDIEIKEFNVGVWHIKVAFPRGRFPIKHYVDTIATSLPFIRRLAEDIWSISPTLFILYLACHFWTAVQEAVHIRMSGILLEKVSKYGLVSRRPY